MGEIRVWDLNDGRQLAGWTTDAFTSWGIIKTHCYVGGIFAITLGFAIVNETATLCSRYTQDHINVMCLSQFGPAGDDVAVVLWRCCQTRAIVDAIVVEKDAKDFVSFLQCGLGEVVGRVSRLVLIRTFVYLNRKFHKSDFLETDVR